MTAANGQQPHILAVSHFPDLLELWRDLLTEEGYRVTTQSHLERDLAEVNRLSPDLVMIDSMWGTTDDNWSLLQLLRLNPPTASTPIVLCTGAVREAVALAEHLREMRIDVVLKPFDIERLLSVIAVALARDPSAQIGRSST